MVYPHVRPPHGRYRLDRSIGGEFDCYAFAEDTRGRTLELNFAVRVQEQSPQTCVASYALDTIGNADSVATDLEAAHMMWLSWQVGEAVVSTLKDEAIRHGFIAQYYCAS